MLETSNVFDEEKVTKEQNITLSRYTIASFPSGILEIVDKHYISLMIEAEETPQKHTIENLKYDALFLLNDKIQSKNDEQNEKNRVDRKYLKTIINSVV